MREMTDKLLLSDTPPAEKCQTMIEVRAGVDAIDSALVALLEQRFTYMDAAARIKVDRSAVRDEARKAEVIRNATDLAVKLGIPADVVRDMWERLVEGSIQYELALWDQKRG
jgi:isochorismate pyruvate lyase